MRISKVKDKMSTDRFIKSDKMVADAKAALRRYDHKAKARVICPKCNAPMRKRSGRYGEFYGCFKYPKCKGTLSLKKGKVQLDAELYRIDNPDRVPSGDPMIGEQPEEASKEFQPSKYQQVVFEFVAIGLGNLMVEAVAGSGKTMTIVEALKLTAGSVLFCAFNKHIQTELARRAPSHVRVQTVHSIGYGVLRSNLPTKPKLDDSKLWGITKELLPENDEYPLRQPLAKMVSLAKKTLTDFTDPQALEQMADYYGIELNGDAERIIELTPKAMAMCAERLAVIDFDDMIWLPTFLNLPMPKFDWVFVDEAQDLSKAQSAIVAGSLKEDGRIVMVGDRSQSIYGFTGADCNSIPRLIEEFGAQTLPLSITYRCPKSVVALAQKLVPQIEAADNAIEGEVREVSEFNWMSQVNDKDLVLCRVNAPLVKACYAFIRRGTKAVIRGRDIGKGLLNFIDKLAPMNVSDLLVKIREYRHREIAKLEVAGKTARIGSIQDRCDTLVALCDGINDLTELRFRIKEIFDDTTKDGVVLSSIHRAKGDEANNVYILKRELLPHPLATKEWQLIQERNLTYVAYTRTKKVLTFVV